MQISPRHYVLVDRKTAPSGKTMRVILLDDGEFAHDRIFPLMKDYHRS